MTSKRRERPEQMACRKKDQVVEYVERGWAQHVESDRKVLSAKVEQTFTDLGHRVNVWNVRTDKDNWWVVEGERVPMNLYPQDAWYFSSDEVYSLHMGVMMRVMTLHQCDPQTVLGPVSHGVISLLVVRRKLEEAARVLADADEPEHLQAVGLTCREALIALGQELVVDDDLPDETEVPKGADFKNRARLAIDRLIPGANNAELRAHARKLCDAAWEFCSSLTHSPTRTPPEAAICLTLAGAAHSLFENLLEKAEGSTPDMRCPVCNSRRLESIELAADENVNPTLKVLCAHCGWDEDIDLVDSAESAEATGPTE